VIPEQQPHARPPDVDTGFWLWVAALPLLVIGYVIDTVTAPLGERSVVVYATSGMFLVVLCAIVVTFLLLMRAGYRWARTLLTGGGIATVVYTTSSLLTTHRPAMAAVAFAVTGIIGSVLIAGGVFLLHRKDSHAYFTR
jgi:MFS family permease